MNISILADTHGYLDEQIVRHLKDSDEIWHAGDVGSMEIIDSLEQLSGVFRVVFGNIDSGAIRTRTAEFSKFEIDGFKVLIIHIAGKPPNYNKQVRELIANFKPHMLVCGHSHILKVEYDKKNNLLYVNPGACGQHGFHKVRTIIQFEVKEGKPTNMRAIELGRRGKIKT